MDEGQNQTEKGEDSLGSGLWEGKKSPFEPLSMKLLLRCAVERWVKSLRLIGRIHRHTGRHVIRLGADAENEAAVDRGRPAQGMLGSCTITPLLS